MADTRVLGIRAERCVGSSPTFRTSLSAVCAALVEVYDWRAVCGESRTYGSEETCCSLIPGNGKGMASDPTPAPQGVRVRVSPSAPYKSLFNSRKRRST